MATTVNIAGEDLKVKFPVSAVIRLQKEHGVKLTDLGNDENGMDMETIIALIWAGVVTHSPDTTVEYLADNIELHEITEIAQVVMQEVNKEQKKG